MDRFVNDISQQEENLRSAIIRMIDNTQTTNRKVAGAIGESYTTFRRYINGERPIPSNVIIKLCRHFQTTPDVLFGMKQSHQVSEMGIHIGELLDQVKPEVSALIAKGLSSFLSTVITEDKMDRPVEKKAQTPAKLSISARR